MTIKPGTFWYVGTPYSKYPAGLEAAFTMACRETARLAEQGIPVYSPIAHSHPISKFVSVSPTDHDFWVTFDKPMVDAAGGLIVVTAEGWQESRGLTHEILEFQKVGKPVVYWDPAVEPRDNWLSPVLLPR